MRVRDLNCKGQVVVLRELFAFLIGIMVMFGVVYIFNSIIAPELEEFSINEQAYSVLNHVHSVLEKSLNLAQVISNGTASIQELMPDKITDTSYRVYVLDNQLCIRTRGTISINRCINLTVNANISGNFLSGTNIVINSSIINGVGHIIFDNFIAGQERVYFYPYCGSIPVVNWNNSLVYDRDHVLTCGCDSSIINFVNNSGFEFGNDSWAYSISIPSLQSANVTDDDAYSGLYSILLQGHSDNSEHVVQVTQEDVNLSSDFLRAHFKSNINNTGSAGSYSAIAVFAPSGYQMYYIFYQNGLDGLCNDYHPSYPNVYIKCLSGFNENEWDETSVFPITDFNTYFSLDFSDSLLDVVLGIGGVTNAYFDDIEVPELPGGVYCDANNDGYADGFCYQGSCVTTYMGDLTTPTQYLYNENPAFALELLSFNDSAFCNLNIDNTDYDMDVSAGIASYTLPNPLGIGEFVAEISCQSDVLSTIHANVSSNILKHNWTYTDSELGLNYNEPAVAIGDLMPSYPGKEIIYGYPYYGPITILSSNGEYIDEFSTDQGHHNSLAVVDVDDDGSNELLVYDLYKVYSFDEDLNEEWSYSTSPFFSYGGFAVADLNESQGLELIVGSSQLEIINSSGGLINSFDNGSPSLTYISGNRWMPVVDDINLDNPGLEILFIDPGVGFYMLNSYGSQLYSYDLSDCVDNYATPAVAEIDVDSDGLETIFVTNTSITNLTLFVFNSTFGEIWNHTYYADLDGDHYFVGDDPQIINLVVGDVTGGGSNEIIASVRDYQGSDRLWIFDYNGNLIYDYFVVAGEGFLPILLELYPDNAGLEITSQETDYFKIINSQGQYLYRYEEGDSRHGPLTIADDLDGDGNLEIISFSETNNFITRYDSAASASNNVWPLYQKDLNNTGYQRGVLTQFDQDQGQCEDAGYLWFTGTVTGQNGACCGDDGGFDDFYNGSLSDTSNFCVDGSPVDQEVDYSEGLCTAYNNYWFTGSLTGTGASCCGDDGAFDIFYNSSHYCNQGIVVSEPDNLRQLCEAKGYSWFLDPAYPVTYSFTNDIVGQPPENFSLFYYPGLGFLDHPNVLFNVSGAYNGKFKVAKLEGIGDCASNPPELWIVGEQPSISSGTEFIDFWMATPDMPVGTMMGFLIGQENLIFGGYPIFLVHTDQGTGDLVYLTNSSEENYTTVTPNQWYNYRFTINMDEHLITLHRDGEFLFEMAIADVVSTIDTAWIGAVYAVDGSELYFDDFGATYLSTYTGPCCGDDGVSDDFHNYTYYCVQGEFKDSCGNGTCESWESFITCPIDCPECLSSDDCDDFNPCTDNTCNTSQRCEYDNHPNGQYPDCTGVTGCGGDVCACVNGVCSDTCGNEFCEDWEDNSTCFYDCNCNELIGECGDTWFYGHITRADGDYCACCGDDGALDDFYNGSVGGDPLFCYNGLVEGDVDDTQASWCENNSFFYWFTGGLTGSNGPCCGDDGSLDNFLNSSLFCAHGSRVSDADSLFYDPLTGDWTNHTLGNLVCELGFNDWLVGDVSFELGDQKSVYWNHRYIRAGDFTGEDDLDVLVLTRKSQNYSYTCVIGNGDGTFASNNTVFMGVKNYNDVVIGDMNNDGLDDMLLVDYYTDFLEYWQCSGSCSFSLSDSINICLEPRSVKLGDFNNDENLDVITLCVDDDEYTIVIGNGDGTFATPSTSDSGGTSPDRLAFGDFDRDGYLDFLNSDDYEFYYLEGLGDGNFSDPVRNQFYDYASDIKAADFNNDGYLDVFTSPDNCYSHCNYTYFEGLGDGSFNEPVNFTLGYTIHGEVLVVDVNNDGNLDLITVTDQGWGKTNISYALGAGDGSFSQWISQNISVEDVDGGFVIGDFDHSGSIDLVFAGEDESWDEYLFYYSNKILQGVNGPCCGDDGVSDDFYNGSLGDTQHFCVDGNLVNEGLDDNQVSCESYGYSWFTGLTDGNNYSCCGDDGFGDNFYNGSLGDTEHFCIDGSVSFINIDEDVGLCSDYGFGYGLEGFNVQEFYIDSGRDYAGGLAPADYDGDGDIDLVSVSRWDNEIVLYDNDLGSFTKRFSTYYSSAMDVYDIDLDDDGLMDFIVTGWGDFSWYRNKWFAHYDTGFVNYQIGSNVYDPVDVFFIDLDEDGYKDILVATNPDMDLLWYENDGTYNFSKNVISGSVNGIRGVYGADLDDDGDNDIIVSHYGVSWFRNDGSENFELLSVDSSTFNEGAYDLLVQDIDEDDDLDIITSGYNYDGSFNSLFAWYENYDGMANFSVHIISDHHGSKLYSEDVDFDGDLDFILGSPNGTVYFNQGDLTFTRHLIVDNVQLANMFDFVLMDINGDPYLDFAGSSTSQDYVKGYLNQGNVSGVNQSCCGDDLEWDNFYNGSISTASNFCFQGSLIDSSLDSNQSFCSYYGYEWLANTCCGDDFDDYFYNGSNFCYYGEITRDGDFDQGVCEAYGDHYFDLNYSLGAEISYTDGYGLHSVDLDDDGDNDIVFTTDESYDYIRWFENDGLGNYTTKNVGASYAPRDVFVADLNGDLDLDVIASSYSDYIYWYDNDGSESFTRFTIDDHLNGAWGVSAADFDGDTDVDVVASGSQNYSLVWYENTDSLGNFSMHTIDGMLDNPRNLYVADLNSDLDNDVLVIDCDYGAVLWYDNDGSGSFSRHVIDGSISGVIDVLAADLDGDLDNDVLAVNDEYEGALVWYENTDAIGNFSKHLINDSIIYPSAVHASDVDGDFDLDLIVSSNQGDIFVYNNDGHGNFTYYEMILDTYALDMRDIISDDYNSDNMTDLFVSTESPYYWFYSQTFNKGNNSPCCGDDGFEDVFFNNKLICSNGGVLFDADHQYIQDWYGNGFNYSSGKAVCEMMNHTWFTGYGHSFNSAVDYPIVEDPETVVVGDYDLDGWLDLAVTGSGEDVGLLINDQDGTFDSMVSYATADPQDLETGDVDLDGWLDLVTCNRGNISVFINDQDGTFASEAPYDIESYGYLSLGDMDNDEYLDIIAINSTNGSISVLFNDQDGTFSSEAIYYTDLSYVRGLSIADFNNDGWLDAAAPSHEDYNLGVLLNNRDGTLASVKYYPVGRAKGIAVGDLDQDSWIDIVVGDDFSDVVTVLLNNGQGKFPVAVDYPAGNVKWVDLGDLDGDGWLDIIVDDWLNDQVVVLFNDGDGTFSTPNAFSVGTAPYNVGVGDFNNDGTIDIAAANQWDDDISILLNSGLTGTGGPCCGDDSDLDDFYNSTWYCCEGSVQSSPC